MIVTTTQKGIHSSFKNIIDDAFGDDDMMTIKYLNSKAGIEWLFEYVDENIGKNDFVFERLWRMYHFGRINFSSLKCESK